MNQESSTETDTLTRHFVKQLRRKVTCVADAQLIFIPESVGFHATITVARAVNECDRNSAVVHWNNKLGVPKTNETTEAMASETRMFVDQHSVRIAKQCIAITNERRFESDKNGMCNASAVLGVLKAQMSRFRRVIVNKPSETKLPTIRYTGKIGTHEDDLCISLLTALFWSRQFMSALYNQNKHRLRAVI